MIRRALSLSLILSLALPTGAGASTLPRADFPPRPTLGLGGGSGIGLAFDTPIEGRWTLGASIGAVSFGGASANADVRALYRFWTVGRDPFTLAAMVGAQLGGPTFGNLTSAAPAIGLAGAYPIDALWTLRVNLAASWPTTDTFRAAGIEVAYRFNPRMEATVGVNGRGDVLGLKLAI